MRVQLTLSSSNSNGKYREVRITERSLGEFHLEGTENSFEVKKDSNNRSSN